MSRHPRAGSAGKLVGIRANDDERREWKRCAKGAGQSLSGWLRALANNEVREMTIRTSGIATASTRPFVRSAEDPVIRGVQHLAVSEKE